MRTLRLKPGARKKRDPKKEGAENKALQPEEGLVVFGQSNVCWGDEPENKYRKD